MKKVLIIILSILIIGNFLFLFSANSAAAGFGDTFKKSLNSTAKAMGYIDNSGKAATLTEMVGKIVQTALGLLGVIFLILMIYGGYLWMLARGNDQEVEKAKGVIKSALIGLIIVISAYAISYFIVSKLGGETLLGTG